MEEVIRYGAAFWEQGPTTFTADAWRRIRTRVEMREKKLAEVTVISHATALRMHSALACRV